MKTCSIIQYVLFFSLYQMAISVIATETLANKPSVTSPSDLILLALEKQAAIGKEAPPKKYSPYYHMKIARAYVGIGNEIGAKKILDIALQHTKNSAKAFGRRTYYHNGLFLIIELMIEVGDKAKAKKILSTIEDDDFDLDNLCIFGKLWAQAGDKNRAKKIIASAREKTLKLEEQEDVAYAYFSIAHALGHTGEKEEARKILSRGYMVAKRLEDDDLMYDYPFALAELGDTVAALEAANSYLEKFPGNEESLLTDLAILLIESGDKKQAKELLKKVASLAEIKRGYSKISGLLQVAMILESIGEKDDARKFADKALVASESTHISHRYNELLGIVSLFSKMGNKTMVEKIYSDMVASAERAFINKNGVGRRPADALSYVALKLVHEGELKWAQEVFKKAVFEAEKSEGWDRAWDLASVSKRLAESGNKEWAKEVAAKALVACPDLEAKSKRYVFPQVAIALVTAGDHVGANKVPYTLSRIEMSEISRNLAKSGDMIGGLAFADKLKGWDRSGHLLRLALGIGSSEERSALESRLVYKLKSQFSPEEAKQVAPLMKVLQSQ